MMTQNILMIETSTETGSVALARNGELVASVSFTSRDRMTGARTEALGPAIADCLARAATSARDITAVICGGGPGGFTSLRVAGAMAKGICSALQISLYSVSSLDILAWSAAIPDGAFIAALPAGRNEWFAADATCAEGRAVVTSAAYLVGDDDLHARAALMQARLVGPGLEHDVIPRADAMVPRLNEIEAHGAVDLDKWEPAYGRLAEAQVKWEAQHGRPLPA
jgi:tRNA threonylcarbamoyladenosine biosynthesis protein TsaB